MRCYFSQSIALVLMAYAFAATKAYAADPWPDQSIYQIVTDRFFDGDLTNDNAEGNYDPGNGTGVHGGDFKGIEQKLDYIKALGATAIWISPVVLNGNSEYHGYAGRDFYNTAPHFGSIADLKHLIDTAHAKGLLMIDDVVVNHGAQLVGSNNGNYPNFRTSPAYSLLYKNSSKQYAAPFSPSSGQSLGNLFHGNGDIQDYSVTNQAEHGNLADLDDFYTERTYVRNAMRDIYNFWIDQGFDGFRIDTVKHVEQAFWQTWSPQIHQHAAGLGKPNFFAFGEIYDGSESKVGSYTGTQGGGAFELDSVLDYPLYFSINGLFATASTNTKVIEDHYGAVSSYYDAAAQMRLVTFLDNHDQTRFLNSANANNNTQRLNVALAFLYSARGIPCLYYGTEQAFNGGADPSNREDMFAGQFEQGPSLGDNFNETHPQFQAVAKFNNLRRLYPALRSGTHVNLWNNPDGPGLFAYSRMLGAQEVFVVFNTAASAQTLPGRSTTYATGTVLVNLLDPADSIVIAAGGLTPSLTIPTMTAKLYLAQTQVLLLDPVVTSITPAHDKSSVPTPSKIVVKFSKPMDTASVESAFAITPAVSGTFAWSDAHDQLTFQSTTGLAELSMTTVHLGETAAASDGTHLHAAFDSRFQTAVHTAQDLVAPVITISSPANGTSVSGLFYVNGTATDNANVQQVQSKIDSGDWQTASLGSGTISRTWLFSHDSSFDLNGTHTLAFRAVDSAGNLSPEISLQLRFANVPPAFETSWFAASSAGYQVQSCVNPYAWISDMPYGSAGPFGYIGGSTYRSSNAISNVCAAEQIIYQSERYGTGGQGFSYLFQCPPGVYQIDLFDAETFFTSGPNQRRFDVYAQAQLALANFDIYLAAGGANLGVTKSFTVTVQSSPLTVDFRPVLDAPRLSALHVKKIGELISDPDGVPDWWRLLYFDHADGRAEDQSRAGDDPDRDGLSNLQEALAGTDPFDPRSRFAVTNISQSSSGLRVDVATTPNKKYQLQRATSLAVPDWKNIGAPVSAGGTSAAFYDSASGEVDEATFYRVIIVP